MPRYRRPPLGYELDFDQGRYRIGLVALANDHVVERDMMSMRPDDDQVHLFVARVPFEGKCNPENLATLQGSLTGVVDTILPGGRLDSVIYSCTSGTAAIGAENVTKCIQASKPDVHCITPVTAAHAAFRTLGVTDIAVLAPYLDEVTAITVSALEKGGLNVVQTTNLGIELSDDISAVTPSSIRAAALLADCVEAEAMFICCTDFRAAQVIEEVEAAIGKPVVTANQATFWQAIRDSGYEVPIPNYGTLLRR